MEPRARAGAQFEFAVAAQQGLPWCAPGFDADHRPRWLRPEHHQVEGVRELEFEAGSGGLIHQPHHIRGPHQQVDATGQLLELLRRGCFLHGEVVEALGWQPLEAHALQAGEVEVRVQPEAERHRVVAPVFHDGGDLQRPGCQSYLHGEQEPERVSLESLVVFAQLQLHTRSIRQGFQAPGQLARKAVLAEVEHTLGQGQLVVRQTSGDREEHRETTPNRLGWVEEALQIEVNNLVASATPAADQPPALGHDPQQIAAVRITELPVGIGSVTLNQRHKMA